MRLDKMLSECGVATRSECGKAARAGKITVNGIPVKKADCKVDPWVDRVVYCGSPVVYRKFVYLMLNKPDGYISATEDGRGDPVVTDLFPPEYRKMGIYQIFFANSESFFGSFAVANIQNPVIYAHRGAEIHKNPKENEAIRFPSQLFN